MEAKPKGPKYRNLVARGGMVYVAKKKRSEAKPGPHWTEISPGVWRFRKSCATENWDVAASMRDQWERAEQHRADGSRPLTFREAAELYRDFSKPVYKSGVRESGLAETTWRDLRTYLREGGPLMGAFGDLELEEITSDTLRAWWQGQPWKSIATGHQYVNVLSNIFKVARVEQRIAETHDPMKPFREWLSVKYRGKGKGAKVNPIEDPHDLHELVAAAVYEGPQTLAFVLLMLDAGLRQGEAMALRWEDVGWGKGTDDRRRKLSISRSLSRGVVEKEPKGKRSREVPLSRRLWWALRCLQRQTNPGEAEPIVGRIDPASWRRREWTRILKRAGMPYGEGSHTPKDLRDTFASQLLSVGVSLERIKKYLGHASVKVTETHYARWITDEEAEEFRLLEGEVRPDFLARLVEGPHQGPQRQTAVSQWARDIVSILEGKKVVELRGFEPLTLRLPDAAAIVHHGPLPFNSEALAAA
jgi:integrase